MRLCSERLRSLLTTLDLNTSQICSSLSNVCDFATIVATYPNGFSIIVEPFDLSISSCLNISDSKISLNCLDSTFAIKPIFDRFLFSKTFNYLIDLKVLLLRVVHYLH